MTLAMPTTQTDLTVSRPRVALAMQGGNLRDALFSDRLQQRLKAVADCDLSLVISDFSAVPGTLLREVDVLLTGWFSPRIDDEVLQRMPRLRLIAHAGGSVKDHVDPACWHRNIRVTTAAIANAVPVAEFTLAQILLAGKSVLAATQLYRERQGKIDREAQFPDTGNYEKVIGIVGASTIGRLVIDRLKPFDLDVLLYDPTISEPEAQDLGTQKVGLEELMRQSDVVSLHAPVLPETIRMVGRTELAAMRTGTTLINTARGDLIDHDALRHELISRRLNAVLDVTSPEPLEPGDPLFSLPNVQLTPHIAGSMGTELHRMTEFAVREIERFAAGQPARHPVHLQDLVRSA
jgi:phosphoglycerate dehydrogenase-like enzyme